MDEFESICFGSACKYVYGQRDIIGAGAFGTVHKASITDPGEYLGPSIVAVKTIYYTKPNEIKGFVDGLNSGILPLRWKTVLQLNNPHVVRYYKITAINHPGIASVEFMMDFKDGDLDSLLERPNDLTLPAVLCYAVQLTEGLLYLHERNIIHADLKPTNILLNFSPNLHHTLVIADLDDLVLMQQNVTCTADFPAARGSRRYMSPEMLKKFVAEDDGVQPPGRKTDIWSLGCVLVDLASQCYEIQMRTLCKTNAESGKIEKYIVNSNTNENVFMMKITDGFAPSVHEAIPRSFANVIQSCLCWNAEKRVSSEEVQRRLRAVAQEYSSVIRKSVSGCQYCLCDVVAAVDVYKLSEETIHFGENHVVFVHEFYCPGTVFVTIRAQLFDIKKRTLQELVLPYTDLHCNRYVPSSFILAKNQMICQAVEDLASASIVIVAYRFDENMWWRVHPNLDISKWWRDPLVIGDKIYHWCDYLSQVSNTGEEIRIASDITPRILKCLRKAVAASSMGSMILLFGSLPTPEVYPYCRNAPRPVTAYDVVTHNIRLIPDVHGLRKNCAFAALNQFLYVTGGDSHGELSTNSCIRLRGDELYWENIASLRRPRTHHGAFTFKGSVYVFGGHHMGYARDTTLSQIMEVYDPKTNAWAEFPFTSTDKTEFGDKAFRHTSCYHFQR